MVDLVWDQAFKKIYIINADLKKSFWEAMASFSQNPFDPKLRTHKLTGKLKGLWSFSVSYDCRVIFRFINDHEVFVDRYWKSRRSVLSEQVFEAYSCRHET